MRGLFGWAWAHVLVALPIIVVIAVVKFMLRQNSYLASFANDF